MADEDEWGELPYNPQISKWATKEERLEFGGDPPKPKFNFYWCESEQRWRDENEPKEK